MTLNDLYREAYTTHRHYDSLSQVAITSIAAVVGGAPVLYKSLANFPIAGGVFFAAIAVLWIAFLIYGRFDSHAAFGLLMAQEIEKLDISNPSQVLTIDSRPAYGVAHAFMNRVDFPSLQTKPGGFIFRMVRVFVIGATVVFFVLGSSAVYYDFFVKPNHKNFATEECADK